MPRSSKQHAAETSGLDQLGAQLGPRLAQVIVDAMTDHAHKTTGHKTTVIAKGIEAFVDLVGAELQPLLAPVLSAIAQHPDLPEQLRPLASFAAEHHGEAASLIRTSVALSGVGTSVGTLVSAMLSPATQQILSTVLTGLLDPTTLATAVAQGLESHDAATSEAARQNLKPSRFDTLVRLAESAPDVGTLQQLLNRGRINTDRFLYGLRRASIEGGWADDLMALAEQLISPADLADMVVRGILPHDVAAAEAAKQGVTAERFNNLVLDSGGPLALEELLLLYRRGQLSEERLRHGIKQSRVRDEWIADAINLRYQPPSAADAIRAAVQNQLPHAEAVSKAQQAGTDPAEFDWLLRTAGRPPGTEQMVTLVHRGLATKDQLVQAIRESDIKDKYAEQLTGLLRYVPPVRSVGVLLREGAISDAQAAQYYTEEGLTPDLVAAEVHAAHRSRTSGARHLGVATIVRLYHDRAISADEARAMLASLGYTAEDAGFTLLVEDLHREATSLDHAITHVRSLYVGYRLTRDQTTAALAQLGVGPDQVGQLMTVWDLERTANAKQLTHGTITQAVKHGVLTPADALGLLQSQGWSAFDGWLLISVALGGASADFPPPANA